MPGGEAHLGLPWSPYRKAFCYFAQGKLKVRRRGKMTGISGRKIIADLTSAESRPWCQPGARPVAAFAVDDPGVRLEALARHLVRQLDRLTRLAVASVFLLAFPRLFLGLRS